MLDGIFWVLHTGARWRELPGRYGRRGTVHGRFTRRRAGGTLDRVLERLRLKLDERGRIDTGVWMADAAGIRAGRAEMIPAL